MTETPKRVLAKPDRAAGEALVAYVPQIPTLQQRSSGWLFAAVTTNPPRGHLDFVTKWIVLTRAAALALTLIAGLLAGLLAIGEPGFSWLYFLLALVGVTAAHVANNLMNDLFDSDVGQDTADYPRAQYAPHPILSGLTGRRQLAAVALGVNLFDLAIMIVLVVARGPWVLASCARRVPAQRCRHRSSPAAEEARPR